jgi:predicted nucleic acid-binding protein
MPDPAKSRGLVLDTSVWINLLATESVAPILSALGANCYAPEHVVSEIKRHPITNEFFAADNHPLRALSATVAIVSLEPSELDLFLDIVGAPATDALGDGEAAAISVAVVRGLDLVIDDRKARRIVREKFGRVQTFWTVDILRAQAVKKALGVRLADECFAKAERFGRMHIPRS